MIIIIIDRATHAYVLKNLEANLMLLKKHQLIDILKMGFTFGQSCSIFNSILFISRSYVYSVNVYIN